MEAAGDKDVAAALLAALFAFPWILSTAHGFVLGWRPQLEAGATPAEVVTASGAFPDIFANLYKNVFGAPIKLVAGYPGTNEITLAMERGEVDGVCGLSWSTIKTRHAQWLKDKKMTLLVQAAFKKEPEMGDVPLDRGSGGVLYIGTKGKMLQDNTGAKPRLLPVELHNNFGAPPEKMPRVPQQSHEMNWVNAIKGIDTISCPFSYAAHLTEIMLLGIASLRAGMALTYDGANMRITNNAAALGGNASLLALGDE